MSGEERQEEEQVLSTADAAVIGAGPIGLAVAIALQQAGLSYLLFEAGQIGHTLTRWPRNTRFFSSPERIALAGVPLTSPDQQHPTGEEYLAYLRALVEQFDLRVRAYEPVTRIERLADGFRLETRPDTGVPGAYRVRAVVLATGGLNRPNLLGIPGEDLTHVSHYFDDPHAYFRRSLLVVGGGNSAVEAAVRCWRAGARVALSYRRAELNRERLKPHLLADFDTVVREGQLRFLPRTIPVRIETGQVWLACCGADGQPDGEPFRFPAQHVLLLSGYRQDAVLFRQLGIRLEGPAQAPVVNPATLETSVRGVYVAGTALGGTQTHFKHFIETARDHPARIAAALSGRPLPPPEDGEQSAPSELA